MATRRKGFGSGYLDLLVEQIREGRSIDSDAFDARGVALEAMMLDADMGPERIAHIMACRQARATDEPISRDTGLGISAKAGQGSGAARRPYHAQARRYTAAGGGIKRTGSKRISSTRISDVYYPT